MIAVQSVSDAFSGADCARLLDTIATTPSRDAGLVRQARDHNLRRADLVWLDDVEGTSWVMDRIIEIVRVANRDVFDFDWRLRDWPESFGVLRQHRIGLGSDLTR